MGKITIFENFSTPKMKLGLIMMLQRIKTEYYKNPITQYREVLNSGNKEEASKLKKALLAFTPSGTFIGGRTADCLEDYSGVVHLDFDKLSPKTLLASKEKLCDIGYILGFFVSPSANGLKVFVKVDTDEEDHEKAMTQVREVLEKELGIKADAKCKDITRLCFISFDPEAYINEDSEVFKVEDVCPQAPVLGTDNPDSLSIESVVDYTNRVASYQDGNRNNYIFQLACNCVRAGIPESELKSYVSSQFIHESPDELIKTITSAYKNQADEFNKGLNGLLVQTPADIGAKNEISQPAFPDELFLNLPQLLMDCITPFAEEDRRRDMMFLGCLILLSGCMPEVQAQYDGDITYPNLMALILAPAASGKGVLKHAQTLARNYEEYLEQNSRDKIRQYEAERKIFENKMRNLKDGESIPEAPVKPPFRSLLIPGNISAASFIDTLNDYNGNGIMIETEADVMGATKKQDWGDYSPFLRQCFHHELISVSRKNMDEPIKIREPKFSAILTGTPSQLFGLLTSVEDGLFSRFIFYCFDASPEWRNVSPQGQRINLKEHFTELSCRVKDLALFLQDHPTNINLTDSQWDIFNANFEEALESAVSNTEKAAASMIFRLGMICFRIIMILTALRKFENGDTSREVFCSNEDFQLAISFVNVFSEHSLSLFEKLSKQLKENNTFKSEKTRMLYEGLPEEFTRTEAVDIGKSISISARTVDDFLKKNQGGLVQKLRHGKYKKITKS